MANEPKPLLTISEVATLLGLSVRTVKRLLANREISFVQVSPRSAVRIRPSEVEKFIEANTEEMK